MKTKLTEGSVVTITDVKRNHSIHSEYYDANDPIAGSKGKDGLDDLNLNAIVNPDESEAQKARDLQTAEDAKLANQGLTETAEAKLAREAEEAAAKGGQGSGTEDEEEEEESAITLDTDGNQVDEQGNIVKTKEVLAQEAASLEEANNIPLIDELISTSGIQILDENGKPKVYEDTIEGIIKYNNDLAELKFKQREKDLFKAFPDVEKYLQAKIKGIPDSEFFGNKLTDWKSVVLDEANLEQQFDVIVKDLEAKGFSKERAIKSATRTKDSGKDVLLEESKLSLESLQSNQVQTEKLKVEKEIETTKLAQEKRDAYWNNVSKIITSGKIGQYVIPEADRKAFDEYVSLAADDNGNSAAAIARAKQSLEEKLILDYYNFKGKKFDGLVSTAITSEKADTLRQRIAKAKMTKGNGANENGTGNTVNLKDIRLENIQRT